MKTALRTEDEGCLYCGKDTRKDFCNQMCRVQWWLDINPVNPADYK
jgi:hypothetical protein